jgi:protein involved in polysaccharide export with SLBB domain
MSSLHTFKRFSSLAILIAGIVFPHSLSAQGVPSWVKNLQQGYGVDRDVDLEQAQRALRKGGKQPPATVLEETSMDEFDAFANQVMAEEKDHAPQGRKEKPSALEVDYRERLDGEITENTLFDLFGYGFLTTDLRASRLPSGSVTEDYILGPGDRVVVTFRGAVSDTYEVTVNRDGQVILPDLPPLSAAGLTLAEFRETLHAAAQQSLKNVESFVSVGQARQVRVLVAGAVSQPGLKQLSSLATLLDALALSGGVKKEGSLRQIRLVRGGKTRMIDLYNIFMAGQDEADNTSLTLRDGDRIIVPAIGKTIAVAGDVQRAGIFELPAGASQLSSADALRYAGHELRSQGNRYIRLRIGEDGSDRVESNNTLSATLGASDILLVRGQKGRSQGSVTLAGHVQTPGTRSLALAQTVRQLVGSTDALLPEPYLLMAIVIRQEASGQEKLLPVNIGGILAGTAQDLALRTRDRLVVFSRSDIAYLWSADVYSLISDQLPPGLEMARQQRSQTVQAPGQPPLQNTQAFPATEGNGQIFQDSEENRSEKSRRDDGLLIVRDPASPLDSGGISVSKACPGLQALAHVAKFQSGQRFAAAARAMLTIDSVSRATPELLSYTTCPEIFGTYPAALPFLLDHVAGLSGEVMVPGAYPIAGTTSLSDFVDAGGGLTQAADPASVVLTRTVPQQGRDALETQRITVSLASGPVNVPVGPGNFVSLQQKPTTLSAGVIRLEGEFRRPGIYSISENETLASVIARAGGLTDEAYPYGAVFTRLSIQKAEKKGYERVAQQLQTGLLGSLNQFGSNKPEAPLLLQSVNSLVENLRQAPALGRMVIDADPAVLAAQPERDILLESGDRLLIPKRPAYVLVSGDVLNPGAQGFRSEASAGDYLRAAGGLQHSADDDRIFLVLPNGEARPLSLSFWNYKSQPVPPGSTIVVPTDPAPFSFLTAAQNLGGLFSQMAVTAASLAVISRE